MRIDGPVDVWWYCRDSTCSEYSSVGWLDLPAGKYLVSAKAITAVKVDTLSAG